ncbi:MAG: hypothetical protein PVG03_02000 [Desulfarculaceae bacterium]|jgi:uncharacterized repeat protein (TIGR04076 family)
MGKKEALQRFADRVGYAPSEVARFDNDDPRIRHMERIAPAAAKNSIIAEVVNARHCNSGYRPGDKFVMDVDGNFISKLCPKKMCVYLVAQMMVPVALINERFSEGLDPNEFHFMREVHCPDSGVNCGGYGEVMVRMSVRPRQGQGG